MTKINGILLSSGRTMNYGTLVQYCKLTWGKPIDLWKILKNVSGWPNEIDIVLIKKHKECHLCQQKSVVCNWNRPFRNQKNHKISSKITDRTLVASLRHASVGEYEALSNIRRQSCCCGTIHKELGNLLYGGWSVITSSLRLPEGLARMERETRRDYVQ